MNFQRLAKSHMKLTDKLARRCGHFAGCGFRSIGGCLAIKILKALREITLNYALYLMGLHQGGI